jgi:hypothetical protein
LLKLDLADNRMNGTVPDSIGLLVLLKTLYLGNDMKSNAFVGPLPSSMSNLIHLEYLSLNVATLTGPMPDFSRLSRLEYCAFTPSQMCIVPEFVSTDSEYCVFSVLPECDAIQDCVILTEWLPRMFNVYTCCLVDGVTCEEDRIVILDLSSTKTGRKISGIIPIIIGDLDKLQRLYLQVNFIGGNLPLSMSNISSLQIVDISNNFLSEVLTFIPLFELIGIESNLGISLPIDLSTRIEPPTEAPDLSQNISNNESYINIPLIAGLSAGFLLIVLFVIAVVILFKRRDQGKESEIELRLLPKYSSPNKQIRLMSKINSGGFGVVWKARYKVEYVGFLHAPSMDFFFSPRSNSANSNQWHRPSLRASHPLTMTQPLPNG